jgi:DNA polymerase-3 subunit alpha
MGAVKGAGTGAVEAIIETREEHGPFGTIWDLTKHLDLRTAGKRTLEALVKAGALDELEGHRAQLLEAVDIAVKYGQKVQADRAAGQNSLFGDGGIGGDEMEPSLPDTEPWAKGKKLKAEHEVIGVYVSGHPLDEYKAEAEAFASAHFGETEALERAIAHTQSGDGRNRGPVRTFCGIITEVNRRTTKNGKPIAFAKVEDFTGQGELVCFASVLDRIQPYLNVDDVVLVKGNAEVRGTSVSVIVQEVFPMWKVRERLVNEVVLSVDADMLDRPTLSRLRDLCTEHSGNCTLYFDVHAPELRGPERLRSRKFVVEPTSGFMRGVKQLFGNDAVTLKGN